MTEEDRCTDARCRACDLKISLARRTWKPPIVHGHFYIVLVEIGADGRIDHEQNFEIVPAYVAIIEGDEPRWHILRSMGRSIEYHDWSITVISRMFPPGDIGWDGDGKIIDKDYLASRS